jgi:hypothetical protein
MEKCLRSTHHPSLMLRRRWVVGSLWVGGWPVLLEQKPNGNVNLHLQRLCKDCVFPSLQGFLLSSCTCECPGLLMGSPVILVVPYKPQ